MDPIRDRPGRILASQICAYITIILVESVCLPPSEFLKDMCLSLNSMYLDVSLHFFTS